MMIDYELLGGLERRLENALHDGLKVSASGARDRCERMLAQAPDVLALRSELESRKERLEAARNEMTKIWAL